MPLAEEHDSEELVIEAVRGGDRYAFDELVARHGRWVRGAVFGVLGKRECVEDVCQQVWAAVWQRIGELRDVRSWRAWLYRMARNFAIDAGRDSSRRKDQFRALGEAATPSGALAPSGMDRLVDGEEHERIWSAIQGLPAIYREPFVLRHLNDWSYRQIAEVTGLPVDSVETRLVRARRLLREALAADGR